MKIGVIDTGVDLKHKRFKDAQIDGFSLCKTVSGKVLRESEIIDDKGHGSGIVSIILQHLPDADIFMIKLKAENGKITDDLMAEAIALLAEEPGMNIINISMGIKTNSPSQILRDICESTIAKNVVINAAAYYLPDKLCFPAHFKSVFGIGEGVVRNKHEFSFKENGMVNALAKGGLQRVVVPDNKFRFSTGTSLATAHFTGIIAKAYNERCWQDRNSLVEWLHANSSSDVFSLAGHEYKDRSQVGTRRNISYSNEDVYNSLRPDLSIKNIAIFPVEEKEMTSILEHQELLTYNLSLGIGYPRIIKLGKASHLLKEKNIPYVNGQLTEKDFDSFDTLVIGYFLDKVSDHNIYYGLSLIKECIKRNKHLIVWDRVVYDLIKYIIDTSGEKYNGKLYLTCFEKDKMDILYDSVDYTELTVPSICVIGTNSRQGKFTTQIVVKQLLEKCGYVVGHLATEPQGILLGADFTFPIGHRGTVSIDLREWNKTIRLLTQIIEAYKKPDIIITGSQGGIFPLHPIDDGTPPEKLCYVKAFFPDAIICSIGPNDSIEFIKRTTESVLGYVKSRILFYVLTPWKYEFHHSDISVVSFKEIAEEEYEERREYYQRELNTPVINIMDAKYYPALIDLIQKNF